jgi:hypothetical protein
VGSLREVAAVRELLDGRGRMLPRPRTAVSGEALTES